MTSIQMAAGDKPTAAQWNLLIPKIAFKTANQTVNNSTTFVNDTHLFVTVDASTTYVWHLHLFQNSGTTPDFKWQFTIPSGATNTIASMTKYDTAGTFGYNVGGEASTEGGLATDVPLDIHGSLVVSTTAGTMQLQWAQNTANASDTIVKANSWLKLIRVDV